MLDAQDLFAYSMKATAAGIMRNPSAISGLPAAAPTAGDGDAGGASGASLAIEAVAPESRDGEYGAGA